MLADDTRRKLLPFLAFAIPLAGLKLAGVIFGGAGPQGADAAHLTPDLPVAAAVTQVRVTDAQRAAAQWIATLAEEPFAPSPMYYEQREEPVVEIAPVPVPVVDRTLRVNVGAIMQSPDGDLALIDGRLYSLGDRLDGRDWTVEAIDSDAGSVSLVSDEGVTATFQVRNEIRE